MINTKLYSKILRKRAIILPEGKVLISLLRDSKQEEDIKEPVNCRGYGRVRYFKWHKYTDWSPDPLPILPAAKALGFTPDSVLRAQIFQNAACNWRCWYCFVDYNRLSANLKFSDYFTADELINMYLEENDRPSVIDLSGGQPDIVPEWLVWMMESIKKHGLEEKIFLWSDDNLSTRYFWKYLTPTQRRYIVEFPKYARVACFKGYDEASFSFNTLAQPECFDQQFEIFRDLLKEGFDMYGYVTFTALPHNDLQAKMVKFVDKLQEIHHNLPLRVVPLKIESFTPTEGRIKKEQQKAIAFQYEVHTAWLEQINKRFDKTESNLSICDISIR
jgi:uncharacterized Fe-S cluster-containing radical SAM superfamily protein